MGTALTDQPSFSAVRAEFRSFRAREGAGYSPLYERLADIASEEPAALEALLAAPEPFRRYTLFFAAVHSLLSERPDEPLAAWFPTLTGRPVPREDPAEAFVGFCVRRRDELTTRIAARRTQTNEVGRAAALLPGLAAVGADRPLGLVELGASAGLNLGLDRFSYVYEGGPEIAGPGGVRVRSELRGDWDGLIPAEPPRIGGRVGLDAEPVDVADDAAVAWLAACVFGDHPERAARLRAAVELAREEPPALLRATLPDGFAELLDLVPEDQAPCAMSSWVMPYLSRTAVLALLDVLSAHSLRRPVSWVALEPAGSLPGIGVPVPCGAQPPTLLAVLRFDKGVRRDELIAVCHPHATWMTNIKKSQL
ncbi:DUF2332 domain-containing protein [Actinocorallia sp. B10E7]|uniref:DUF2332 domain-containing protein n=1 Tax=Actinocorallia sp. B10E7 TaxID=3153558 RepID=UPI00325E7C10